MYDIDNVPCPNPEQHPGRSLDIKGGSVIELPYEVVGHLPGSYTTFCEACQHWIQLEVRGDIII